jgi:rSAM/selenodomain-associated transferase 1
MTDDVLVIMAKQPVAGAVKTRLARAIGAEKACALYAAFLRDLAARFAGGPWQLAWAVDPPSADLSGWVGAAARQFGQEGAQLDERMQRCFARLFAGGAARVVMIGADVPHLREAVVGDAFAALDDRDVALVPTRDGGYCLIGLRAPHDLFTGLAMGTSSVFAATTARIAALGLRARIFDTTFDIDELDDLRDLARVVAAGDVDLAHCATALRTIGLSRG